MKGISAVIAVILILMISVSLTGLGYITFTTFFTQITNSSQGAISNTLSNMLAQMKIESITNTTGNTKTMIYIRNTGKVDLTNFAVYDDDNSVTIDAGTPVGGKIPPGEVGNINVTGTINSGSVIKVTSGQGAMAIQSKP